MGRVTWTAEAERWLSEIHDYIAEDNPSAAQRTVQGIYEKGLSLADFPERGYRHVNRSGKSLRILLYGHYRIARSSGCSTALSTSNAIFEAFPHPGR